MTASRHLARQEAAPALLRLHRSLSRLDSVLHVMNTGAHPDDEQSGLLAWLRFGRGLRVTVACSTRGEGGQNILDGARGAALGLLRSREMEEAARVLDADVAWLGHGPDDPVHDFGFSKDGDDTFARWGEERIVERLVRAYRAARPDIVIPTFLDVPGQHGHHRAMTRAARTALALAADPEAFPEQGLAPWRVAKFYLPAWSGGGGTYDDELPPPQTTLTETVAGRDPATGADYARIGEWSRARHASQGMGRWHEVPARSWNLHYVDGPAETTITAGLPATLEELAALAGPAAEALTDAARAVAAARRAFPDRALLLDALAAADAAIAAAQEAAEPGFAAAHGHRLDRKRQELSAALFEAAGLEIDARPAPALLAPGGTAEIAIRLAAPLADTPLRLTADADLPEGLSAAPVDLAPDDTARLAVSAAPGAPFPAAFRPGWAALGGNGPGALRLTGTIAGRPVRLAADLSHPLEIGPREVLEIEPEAVLLRRGHAPEPLRIGLGTPEGRVEIDMPEGWSADLSPAEAVVTPPADLPEGLTVLRPRLDGRPALGRSAYDHPQTGPFLHHAPAELRVLSLDLALPEGARVAYLGGGGDNVGRWLGRMGVETVTLDRIEPHTDLSGFTTVLIGIVAFGARADLAAATPALHRFVRAGGHLVTLYQRPDQGWQAETTPPLPLEIGTPSLRWRTTDEAAPVTMLRPEHPLLSGPNRIGPRDWDGWDKERGLYFAARRDPAYEALLKMSDPGEAPLDGALVSAPVGRGRHTHCALVLHHQLDRMVPGAFRLLANLVQPA
ncbi:PIG-L family deacetylase [Limimaricola pyoseonensis]|uniref:N-acetylglucosaminyl deacetylase, LmbE family n=1 Tax=Limimaricola pyoseonensis TaxID=521013 RepID=A0A1G7HKV7_9RHOB|nr:PIG-L family deacetylase [Limimaricola pyoseonensis]SDF01102.1 N-acetylglucosaminyl deacetylase, LmbE family [Limimaricola pyoseonensis]